MGFFDKRKAAAEDRRRRDEEDERLIREYDEDRRRGRNELLRVIGGAASSALGELGIATSSILVEIGSALTDYAVEVQAERAKIDRMLKDPNGLDELSDTQLEHLRITTESDIAYYESLLKELRKDGSYDVEDFLVHNTVHEKRLLFKLIEANQARRKRPQLKESKTAAERRKELSADIQELMTEKADTIKQLTESGASEEEVMQLENIYDDAINRKQFHLRKIMGQ